MKLVFILIAIVLPIASPIVLAAEESLTIYIDMSLSFKAGEVIFFDYRILSDLDTNIRYIVGVKCSTAPASFLEEKTAELKENVPFPATYHGVIVDESIEPEICTAYVEILEPFHQKAEKEFKIETKPSFDIWILACKDLACVEKSKVFVKGEKVYFDFDSEVPGPEVKGKLIAPDKSMKDLILPTSIVLDQVGKYTLETETKKEGYKTNIQTLELVVLKEIPKVIDKRICNANGICEPDRGETIQNCPQDCLSPKALEIKEKIEEEKAVAAAAKRKIYCILGGIGILLAIGAGVYYFYWRRRRTK